MRLYDLSGRGAVMCHCGGRGLQYTAHRKQQSHRGQNTTAGNGLLLQSNLGASTAGYPSGAGLIRSITKPMTAPIQDTNQLQNKLAGLSNLRLSGKKKYVNL